MNSLLIILAVASVLIAIIVALKKRSSSGTSNSYQLDVNYQTLLDRINESIKKSNDQIQKDFIRQYQEMNQRIEKNFEAAANKSLVNNVDVVQSVSSKSIEQCLKPLVSELKNYEEKIEKMIKNESTERLVMSDVLKSVSEINKNFSEQATKFTSAILGSCHGLGRFGEESLKTILESSGFTQDHDFLLQQEFSTPTNPCIRPDCTLLIPGKRCILIDSKFSLNSFIEYQESTDINKRKEHAKELVKNLKSHANELAKKEYHNVTEYESLPFVFMFVASDPALTLALSVDNAIIRSALEKNILIVGPTTFLASLKTVSVLWREEKQKENIKEIAEAGKILYEKFKLFVDRMKDVQKHFEKSSEALDTAFNHLNRGEKSLVAHAQVLKELGINSEKEVA